MALHRERTEYGERLYEARKRANLTQPQLAKAAGMSQGTLAELEYKGNSSTYTAQIAAACGVRAEWLATGNGPMLDEAISQDIAEVASAIDKLPKKQRDWALEALRQTLNLAMQSIPLNGNHVTKPARRVEEDQMQSAGRRRKSG